MNTRIFISLLLLACKSPDKKESQATVKTEPGANLQRRQEKEIGFVVLNGNFNPKNALAIYNSDGSRWRTFRFSDTFEDADINPAAIKPENSLLVFECLKIEKDFYKVVVSSDRHIIKYISKSDKNFSFQTLQEHILSAFSIDFNEKENPLRSIPDENSAATPKNKDSFYYPVKITKEWLLLEDDSHEKYWVKWRDINGKIIIETFYDA